MGTFKAPVAVVTGASRGIGRAVALRLGAAGFRLALGSRSLGDLEGLVAEIEAAGGEAMSAALDVRDDESVATFAQEVLRRFDRVDLLVANAGIGGGDLFWTMTPDEIRSLVETNFLGVLRTVGQVLPTMRRQHRGSVVIVASVAGEVALPGSSLYAATKAALVRFSDGLGREVRRDGLRVTAILPGFVRTDMTRDLPFPMPGPDVVARAVLRAYRRGPRRIVVPGFYVLLIALARLAPWLVDVVGRGILRDMQGERRAR